MASASKSPRTHTSSLSGSTRCRRCSSAGSDQNSCATTAASLPRFTRSCARAAPDSARESCSSFSLRRPSWSSESSASATRWRAGPSLTWASAVCRRRRTVARGVRSSWAALAARARSVSSAPSRRCSRWLALPTMVCSSAGRGCAGASGARCLPSRCCSSRAICPAGASTRRVTVRISQPSSGNTTSSGTSKPSSVRVRVAWRCASGSPAWMYMGRLGWARV